MGRGILLWLLGVPIPVIILLWLFFGHWSIDGPVMTQRGLRIRLVGGKRSAMSSATTSGPTSQSGRWRGSICVEASKRLQGSLQ